MKTLRQAIVIHSPHSGRSERLDHALAELQQVGIEAAQVIPISTLDDLPPQGSQWRQEGIDIAIAAGGDGLVGGVINHVIESGLPLGVLPLGTANDIARSLHIPMDLRLAARAIVDGKEQGIDVGTAQPAEQAPHLASPRQSGPLIEQVPLQKHAFFAHALTVGLNVQFARIATNVATRQRYGRLTYPIAALEALHNHQALEVELRFEGLELPQGATATEEEMIKLSCKALQVAVINAPIFGGQWHLTIPGASLSDQLLDIVVIQDIDLGKLSSIIARFLNIHEQGTPAYTNGQQDGTLLRHPAELSGIPGIHHLRAHGVTITSSSDPRDVTLDGEVRGQTPMYVHMAEQRLRVMVPA